MPTSEYLEVSVEILRKLAQTSIVYKDHVTIVKVPMDSTTQKLIEQAELDSLSRIVHDLPPRPLPYHDWRKIPGFSCYTMNPTQKIIEDATDLEVPVKLGRLNNVLLTDDDGLIKRMSVRFLFNITFPELAHLSL